MRRLLSVFLLLALGLSVAAQDAGQVLSTFVSFSGQRAAATLNDDQKAELDKLTAAARAATGGGQHGEALRHLYHGLAIVRGTAWTPEAELWASLETRPGEAIWEPGRPVEVRFHALYPAKAGGGRAATSAAGAAAAAARSAGRAGLGAAAAAAGPSAARRRAVRLERTFRGPGLA